MASQRESPKVIERPPDPPPSVPRCSVEDVPGEGLRVTFLIDKDVAGRLKSRAGTMPLHRYLYENVLYRAIIGHVY